MVSVQYITKTGSGQERTKELEISMTAVCTSVKIIKIRRTVNEMGGHVKLKWIHLPHSKMEGGEGGGGAPPHPFILLSLKS